MQNLDIIEITPLQIEENRFNSKDFFLEANRGSRKHQDPTHVLSI